MLWLHHIFAMAILMPYMCYGYTVSKGILRPVTVLDMLIKSRAAAETV